VLWVIGLELRLLSVAEGVAGVARRRLVHHVQVVGSGALPWLDDHAAGLLVLYLGDEMAIVLHVLHHQVVVR